MESNLFQPLILYTPGEGRPLQVFDACYRACMAGMANEETRKALHQACYQVFSLARQTGFSGNIWQCLLTYHLLNNENPYSLSCEGKGLVTGSLARLARGDLEKILQLFSFDFSPFQTILSDNIIQEILHFEGTGEVNPVGALVGDVTRKLNQARQPQQALEILSDFYRNHGVGKLAFYRAFHLDERGNPLPVKGVKEFSLQDLVGYEPQKEQLVANTQALLTGKPSNNVLLYGDAGTGKSTCVRSLLTDFAGSPLRLVELSTAQLEHLTSLMATLRERNYKFIVFIDDLSFEEHETGYKHLKAVIEGGLETMPDNVRVYATSNRRHLIKETWKDKSDMEHDGDIHRSDTVEEKLSLAARFGVAIHFPSPARQEYYNIVKTLAAQQLPYPMDEETLLHEADRWEIRHGGISGRAAQQFIDYLAGKEE